ncbi:MAG: hypothetical protein U0903_01495 [Planctomycetales bacterium]
MSSRLPRAEPVRFSPLQSILQPSDLSAMSDPQITLPAPTGAAAGLRVAMLALATLGFMALWTEMEGNAGVAEEVKTERKESHSHSEGISPDKLPGVIQLFPRPEQEIAQRIVECKQTLWGMKQDCEIHCRSIALLLGESPMIRGLTLHKPQDHEQMRMKSILEHIDSHQLLELNVVRGMRFIAWKDLMDAGCEQLRTAIAKRMQIEAEEWMRVAAIRWQLGIHKLPRITSGGTGETRTR